MRYNDIIFGIDGSPCQLKEFWVNVYSNGFGRCWKSRYWADNSIKRNKPLYCLHVRMK